ncbi:nucleolar protein 3-like [Eucalyptus grandis]|uniref:nucleolar protein 3-like n=1 Tax=Eucalyptus grandis TaxID=71139 RepID=UPI000527C46E|nr:nucleolar protein 3-like [Eucalyptus grandis]
MHNHPEGPKYILIKSTVWVDVSKLDKVPHEYRSWYHHYHDGRREGPMPKSDVPLYVLEEMYREGTTNPKDGLVVNVKDPKLGDPESPLYSNVDSSWSIEERVVINSEDDPEEEPDEENDPEGEPEEDSEDDSEEDPEDDPKYDPDED